MAALDSNSFALESFMSISQLTCTLYAEEPKSQWKRMARPVCKSEFRVLVSLLQRIRPHGHAVAKMDIRAPEATIINTVSKNHFHCRAYRAPIDCQAI
jgi:hypothetical protein